MEKKLIRRRRLMTDILYIETNEYEDREAVFGEEDAGKRLDAALADFFPDLSRSRLQSILEDGLICPANATKNTRVKPGDVYTITVNKRVPLKAEAEDIRINVVYEDSDVLVVDKERGMVVHPAKGNLTGTLVNALLGRYKSPDAVVRTLSGVSGSIRPGIVHRIDKNTSGLLVVAKNDAAHTALAAQFAAHTITRRYKAIGLGGVCEEEGTIDAPIGRDPQNRFRQAIVHDGGKNAVTHWRALERVSGRLGVYTLFELALETGRTHQIRVHMASIGHPILGDDLYGAAHGPMAREGQYLHAGILGFDHPSTGESLLFESPLPEYFTDMLVQLKRH